MEAAPEIWTPSLAGRVSIRPQSTRPSRGGGKAPSNQGSGPRIKDQNNEGIGVCCAPKQIQGLVLDSLGPWGMGLRSRSCRNPLKVKNAMLEAPGNSQNNPGTRWNLAVQSRNCSVVNSTILEWCEISPGIFRPLCEINPVRNFFVPKNSRCENFRPPCMERVPSSSVYQRNSRGV